MNSEWDLGIEKIIRRLEAEFEYDRKLSAKLNKMLIIKPGGFIQRFKNEEKFLFCTLIIQSRTISEGGEIIIYNGLGKKVGSTIDKDAYSFKFTAIDESLQYEIKENKNEFNAIFIYSICFTDDFESKEQAEFDLLSKTFERVSLKKFKMALMLENTYVDNSVERSGFNALIGVDLANYNLLKTINENLSSDKKL